MSRLDISVNGKSISVTKRVRPGNRKRATAQAAAIPKIVLTSTR